VSSRRAIDDPILKRCRAALDDLYGDRLEPVALFGSPACVLSRNLMLS
jgi:hypothetical protein